MVLYVDICLLEFTLIFSDAIFGWIRLSRIHVKTLNPVETFLNQVTHINLYFSNLKFGMRCLTCWRHFPLDTNIPRSWTATTVSTAICVVSVSIVNKPISGLCTVLTFTRVSVNDFFFIIKSVQIFLNSPINLMFYLRMKKYYFGVLFAFQWTLSI